ncbi:hypothetical protein NC651_018909 [Populus alba x Populus x berolinensis]|nr:hypothetical protein NC651_018909 [Populus alba x Populus x berolinensis]
MYTFVCVCVCVCGFMCWWTQSSVQPTRACFLYHMKISHPNLAVGFLVVLVLFVYLGCMMKMLLLPSSISWKELRLLSLYCYNNYYHCLLNFLFHSIIGCLLRSLPPDVILDNSTGFSITCDLNDNIAAPWPSSSSISTLSLCAPEMSLPALPTSQIKNPGVYHCPMQFIGICNSMLIGGSHIS